MEIRFESFHVAFNSSRWTAESGTPCMALICLWGWLSIVGFLRLAMDGRVMYQVHGLSLDTWKPKGLPAVSRTKFPASVHVMVLRLQRQMWCFLISFGRGKNLTKEVYLEVLEDLLDQLRQTKIMSEEGRAFFHQFLGVKLATLHPQSATG